MIEDEWNELITKCDMIMAKIKLAKLKCNDKYVIIKIQAIENEMQQLHDDLCDMSELDLSQNDT